MLLYSLLMLALLYLIGSIPFGLIVSVVGWDIDPREVGSQNIGMSNVLRSVGLLPGVLTLIGDMGKAWIGLVIGSQVLSEEWLFAGAYALVIGHCWSIFLALKGGKGVASTGGVLLFFQPLTAVICTLSWFALRATIFSSSLSSLSTILLVIFLTWFSAPAHLPLFLGLSVIILVRHKDNLERLREGTENR